MYSEKWRPADNVRNGDETKAMNFSTANGNERRGLVVTKAGWPVLYCQCRPILNNKSEKPTIVRFLPWF